MLRPIENSGWLPVKNEPAGQVLIPCLLVGNSVTPLSSSSSSHNQDQGYHANFANTVRIGRLISDELKDIFLFLLSTFKHLYLRNFIESDSASCY